MIRLAYHVEHLAEDQQTKLVTSGPSRPHISSYKCQDLAEWRGSARGLSSAGRAPDLHSGGQEFDPPRLHHFANGPVKNGSVAQVVRAHA